MKRTFVLIHGSWHGAWAWKAVMRYLLESGHRAYAPTLAGCGPDAIRHGITHQDLVASVATYIQQYGLDDVVLVGHSFGGTVVQKVTEQLRSRIARIVFLDALILEHNECVFDILPPVFLQAWTPNGNGPATPSLDGAMEFPPPPWATWRDNFIQDAPESVARSIWEQLSPDPPQIGLDRLDLKRFYSVPVPKTFIYCSDDKAMPVGYFHPRMSSRLGTFKLFEMSGSHEVMFTRPGELADKLIEASSD